MGELRSVSLCNLARHKRMLISSSLAGIHTMSNLSNLLLAAGESTHDKG
jgi:hypothetical protein